jgi:hypothetical protein
MKSIVILARGELQVMLSDHHLLPTEDMVFSLSASPMDLKTSVVGQATVNILVEQQLVNWGNDFEYESTDASAILSNALRLEAAGCLTIESINGIPFADCWKK